MMGPPSEVRDWLSVSALLMSVGGIIYTWLTRDAREAGAAVAKLEAKVAELKGDLDSKIDKLEDRVGRIEGELRHLPDKASVHRMELSLTELRGDMKALTERVAPVAAVSERLQEFLLEKAKGN